MTESSPGVGNTTVTMMRLSSGTSTTGYTDNTGGYAGSNAIGGSHYYPGWYPKTYGYTCPNCGAWVNGLHACYPKPVYPTVIYQPVYIPQPTDLTPLLEKLDDLTKELKKLRKDLQNIK